MDKSGILGPNKGIYGQIRAIKDLLPGHSTMTKCKCQKFNCKVKALGTFIDL